MILSHKDMTAKARRWSLSIFTSLPLGGLGWAFASGLLCCGVAAALTSCSDFFDQESDHVIYADSEHLNNAVDSVYSMTGILSKLQVIADRTILLGEVRADLVDLTGNAASDLHDLAEFNVSDDNPYNQPSDYYAVINNCNYYIAHADTALRNSRNEYVFMREYAAVRTIRAWTYLQLALNYGSVPFVDQPILSKEDADGAENGPRYDLQQVCDYFISDLEQLRGQYTNAEIDIANEYPMYGSVGGYNVRFFFFPLDIVLGDLHLWRASLNGNREEYKTAAQCYYRYINERNGENSAYPTGASIVRWMQGTTTWMSLLDSWSTTFVNYPAYTTTQEVITLIPGSTSRSDGSYSELRDLFCSTSDNDYQPSIMPSQAMQEISEAQAFCAPDNTGLNVSYAPSGLTDHQSGDLRLYAAWTVDEHGATDQSTGEYIETSSISKYGSIRRGRETDKIYNVRIYRRQMLYWRMAEAFNQAGYPRLAYKILETGINNEVLRECEAYYTPQDTAFFRGFDFQPVRYGLYTTEDWTGTSTMAANHNTIGMHTRGSGWTPMNEYYRLPNDTIEPDDAKRSQLIAEQQLFVDSLLLNENALEFAFEGTRFYDLMRFAIRKGDTSILADRVYARRGRNAAAAQSGIAANLRDQRNWYLNWNNKIGYQ